MSGPSFDAGGVPRPFVVPRGPVQPGMGSGPEFSRRLHQTKVRASGTNHLPNGEWTICYPNIDVISFPKLNYDKVIRKGQFLFSMNQKHDPSAKAKLGHYILPVFCLNDALKRAKRSADILIGPIRDEMRAGAAAVNGGHLPAAADLGDDATRRQLVKLLSMPEHCWSYLFKAGSALMNTNDGFSLLQYLCAEGIFRKYNLIGTCDVAPQVQYGPTEKPREHGRFQMTAIAEGVAQVDNLWPDATYGSHLFFKLVRVRERTHSGRYEYDQFAVVSYSNQERKELPPRQVQYEGTSGMDETGIGWYVGQVIDMPNPPPSPDTVKRALGITSTSVMEADSESQRCGKIKILQVSPMRVI